jgi:hypothetical protein
MVKINRFSIKESLFQKEEEHKFCRKIKNLLHDYCLKDLHYKYDLAKYYKNGNLMLTIKIFGMINKGWLNTQGFKFTEDSYLPFKKAFKFY